MSIRHRILSKHQISRSAFSWALYDWANSAYATTVMAGFFPLFFKQYWSADNSATESTFQLGMANSAAGLVIVLLAPLLGAIADQGGARKYFLFLFAALGITMTAALNWVAQGEWALAIVFYVCATIGFMGANVFYDALIVVVAGKRVDVISALGYACGYLGGGLLFSVNVAMTLWPGFFGLQDAAEAVRVSFVMVAIWWALFSVPLLLFVKEPKVKAKRGMVLAGFKQLLATFKEIRRYQTVFVFLLAYWFYIDGVDTVVRMAVDYGLALGFDSNALIVALLITQFIGFPAALMFGKLGEQWGPKRGIYLAIGVYILVVLAAYFMNAQWQFYCLAAAIGLVQGGIQSLSRSYYTRLIPQEKATEFFGFYNMWGKFAAVIGPVMMGWVAVLTGSSRYAILSIIVLFIVGAVLLFYVNDQDRIDAKS